MTNKARTQSMQKHRKSSLAAAITLFFIFGLASVVEMAALESPLAGLSGDDEYRVNTGLLLFDRAYNSVWSGSGLKDANLVLLDRSATLFQDVEDAASRFYLMARVELYRGRITLYSSTKAKARVFFENAMDLAQKSLAERESAEGYRVLADAASSWMVTKGLGGIIRMAPQVQEWSDAAVQMDPSNALAILINSQGQINAPASAGGDPDAAVRRLLVLSRRGDLTPSEDFWTRVSLSQAYKKLKQRDESREWCEKAREIFPNNPLVDDCP